MRKISILIVLIFTFSVVTRAQATNLDQCLEGAWLANQMTLAFCQMYLDGGDPISWGQCTNNALLDYQAAQASCIREFPIMTMKRDYRQQMFDYVGIRHHRVAFL